MVINSLCLRKNLKKEVKSSLTRLDFIKNKPSKNGIKYCFSAFYRTWRLFALSKYEDGLKQGFACCAAVFTCSFCAFQIWRWIETTVECFLSVPRQRFLRFPNMKMDWNHASMIWLIVASELFALSKYEDGLKLHNVKFCQCGRLSFCAFQIWRWIETGV